jgi:hypothetical protein
VSTIQEGRKELEEEEGKGTGKLTIHKWCQREKGTEKKVPRGRRSEERRSVRKGWGKKLEEWRIIKDVWNGG